MFSIALTNRNVEIYGFDVSFGQDFDSSAEYRMFLADERFN